MFANHQPVKHLISKAIATIAGTSTLLLLQFSLPNFLHTQLPGLSSNDLLTSEAIASSRRITYVPPNYGSPRRTTSNASRGCDNLADFSLYLLAPKEHVGVTTLDYPSFFWYISAASEVPVEFALVEEGVPKPLWKQKLNVQKAGVMSITIPQDAPPLLAGRDYKWSVRSICNPISPSAAPPHISWIRRVPLAAELQHQLRASTSNRDRAFLYAKAGMWYDAIAAAIQLSGDLGQPSQVVTLTAELQSLLAQVGLPKFAESSVFE
ncbi:MAG: DUF928 domain-containing protein [Pseudanabaena sp. RU_4_16]|nr:DUF928 domain-containing protein [Pseudanabaena sp. RU_4_16]NKB18229.1 DUF928 domain-containing protein [Pseudanabaena sp. CRU_2_10]